MNSIGSYIITSCTLSVPESGSWVIDILHDLATGDTPPSGKVTCSVGGTTFVGTVDPTASGIFTTQPHTRVVGAIEWRTVLPKRNFKNPAGVTTAVVIQATAAELGIPVSVTTTPVIIGPQCPRIDAEAYQVLGRSGWWVAPSGLTTVGPRTPTVPGDDFFLQDYDALSRTATVTTTTPIFPGMVITDTRLPGGSMLVREVKQTWDASGVTASLWLDETSGTTVQGPKFTNRIQRAAIGAIRPEYLTHYSYEVQKHTSDGYALLADVKGPVPNATSIQHWPGIPGFSCTVADGTNVLVGFRGREPVVLGFDATPPTSATWDYQSLNLGGDMAKPTANADIISAILDLITNINTQLAGTATAPYAGLVTDIQSIKNKLAAMKTKSA